WALDGSEQANYLATSPSGTATGFGCKIMIIDDLIKNAEEAYNEVTLQKQIDWFNNTMLSRTEKGFKLIIIMTRWATGDLAGYILENFQNVQHINYKAVQDDGSMLCEDVLSFDEFKFKTKTMNADIVAANYQQEPIDIKGRLYGEFKTYTTLPEFKQVRCYIDTADTGSDYLAGMVYGVTFDNEAYILDVLYTKAPMEVTEPAAAKMLNAHNVNVAYIESNNGGRGFARSVERILRSVYQTNKVNIKWFTQHKNKAARILSNATWCMEHIYFPVNWRDKWSELYSHLMKYQKEGKNAHDDAEDALTGIAEDLSIGITVTPKRVNY
ncbi:MAG: phage terminase large subunit, partial [Clostridia bacterium]|nr:phage terminase large subunit [Clostridia bacterium]